MKKLKLNLGDLKVESFETSSEKRNNAGTVKGFHPTPYCTEGGTNCPECNETEDITCGLNPTCWESCFGTCVTCDPTCGTTCANTCDCPSNDTCHGRGCILP